MEVVLIGVIIYIGRPITVVTLLQNLYNINIKQANLSTFLSSCSAVTSLIIC